MRVTMRAVSGVLLTVARALCLGMLAALVLAPSAWSASPCAKDVLSDWRDDGRIDRLYPLPCYEQAIDAIPADLVPYANADEVIARALQAASRRQGGAAPRFRGTSPRPGEPPVLPPQMAPPVSTSATTALPLPLIVLGGLALTLLATGGLGWIARRRRGPD